QQRGVIVLAYCHHDIRAWVQLTHREHDEDGGIVAVNGDEHLTRLHDLGPAQNVTPSRVPFDGGIPTQVRVSDGGWSAVDDNDLVGIGAVVLERLNGTSTLGAKTDDDDVIAHPFPPTCVFEHTTAVVREYLKGRSDQQHQERHS